MNKPRIFLILIFLALLCGKLCSAQRIDCSVVNSQILRRPVRYCIMLPASYDTNQAGAFPILYFLHALGQDEQALITSGAWNVAADLRRSGKIGDFLVATPDAGRSFYINSLDGKFRYEDFFMREFIPAMEQKYRVQCRVTCADHRRAIAGVSMGGYGALRFAFRYPQKFEAVAAQMAALYDQLPPAFMAGTAAVPARHLDAITAFGSPPSEPFWQQQSPLTLARRNEAAIKLRALNIYFDCGAQDDYGFDAGARSLDRVLNEFHIRHEFRLYPGGHDWRFVLAHFADAWQFLWNGL